MNSSLHLGHWIPMVAFIALAFNKDTTMAILLLVIAVGINSSTYLGFQVRMHTSQMLQSIFAYFYFYF